MSYYAVIDTNVLVSSLLSSHDDSATVQIVKKIYNSTLTPILSKGILTEYKEVLSREKFHFSPNLIQEFLDTLIASGMQISPRSSNCNLPDKDDLPFYDAHLAAKNKNAYLITGNIKHFPESPLIVTPRQSLTITKAQFPCTKTVQ